MNLVYAILALATLSFAISWAGTLAMKRIAPKIGFVDKPGGRKIHANPKPLGGGVAIFLGFALPVLAGLLIVHFRPAPSVALSSSPGHVSPIPAYWSGIRDRTPVALEMIAAALLMHVLGLFDDRKALGPYFKLFVQLSIITGLVLLNPEIRALTFLNRPGWYGLPSIVVTVLWIGAITNAFNFLDNMDGLSAGVAAVCTAAFMVAALSIQQWFVAASLALLLGSLLGFLCFNFAPASIFMGDSGSLLIGLLLGSLTVRTTYLQPGEKLGAGWYSILAPVIVLAVPLYDLVVVSTIRLLRGKSPFVGDTNHFSHRLVARGMSRRTAVLCLYLISAATAIAAIILPHAASTFVAVLVFVQTLLILGVVMLLEQHPLPTVTDTKLAPAKRAERKEVVELMGSPPKV
ncbi:MAG: putative undecaprenyl-phosphate N-acetylglucosaminyl 1-phosphate transferase [Phycisphaerales bacterium]|nr:putative undecaprenyl-phosphate N-acetylglucosaminyl 1-phosphate transferase [Phycisphaerales bacterium]